MKRIRDGRLPPHHRDLGAVRWPSPRPVEPTICSDRCADAGDGGRRPRLWKHNSHECSTRRARPWALRTPGAAEIRGLHRAAASRCAKAVTRIVNWWRRRDKMSGMRRRHRNPHGRSFSKSSWRPASAGSIARDRRRPRARSARSPTIRRWSSPSAGLCVGWTRSARAGHRSWRRPSAVVARAMRRAATGAAG